MNGGDLKIDDSFTYLGSFDPTVMTSKGSDRLRLNSEVNARGDVFVKSVDGVASEVIILQRMSLRKSGLYWNPNRGTPVDFQGISFKEQFFWVTEGQSMTTDSYVQQIREQGYNFYNEKYAACLLNRNQTRRLKMSVVYAAASSVLAFPEEMDSEEGEALVRKRLNEVVTIVN